MFEQPLKFLVVFFVVVEPISLIPLFSGLTTGATAQYRRRMALKAVVIAAAILVLFALGGASFLELMGISLRRSTFSAACCCFCCRLRWYSRASPAPAPHRSRRPRASAGADISVFPLAFPFIAGPGALATILLWFGPVHLQANSCAVRRLPGRRAHRARHRVRAHGAGGAPHAGDRGDRRQRFEPLAGGGPRGACGAVRTRWPAPGLRRRLTLKAACGRRGPRPRGRGARRGARSASARARRPRHESAVRGEILQCGAGIERLEHVLRVGLPVRREAQLPPGASRDAASATKAACSRRRL